MQELKKKLRKKAENYRKSLEKSDKLSKDETIFKKIIALKEYKEAKTLLCYVSVRNEIDTKKLIEYSLKIGKKVAVPKCFENRQMKFFYISSFDELETGSFGILEPKFTADLCKEFDNSLCIIPALMVDKSFNRLGYGGGYYDRFLKGFNSVKCVVCYKDNLIDELPSDEFDVKADLLITD